MSTEAIIREARKATFFTFYSYKGGVGRTLSLINTAYILAGRGRRVLMIDFDLEAPGLSTIPSLSPAAGERPGLIDLVDDFMRDSSRSPLTEPDRYPDKERRSIHEYITPVCLPAPYLRVDGGCLDLLTCGRLTASSRNAEASPSQSGEPGAAITYGQKLTRVNLPVLYEQGLGRPLFQKFKDVIIQHGGYEYVLVDSRTGFADESGICTRDIADYVVVVMGLNRQNVEGTQYFLRSLRASGWPTTGDPAARVLFVVSPVPVGNDEKREERLADARHKISAAGFRSDLDLILYYHPDLALNEDPAELDYTRIELLFPSYERLQFLLRRKVQDAPEDLVPTAFEAFKEGRFEHALQVLRSICREDVTTAKSTIHSIMNLWTDYSAAAVGHVESLFQLLSEVDPDNIYALQVSGRILMFCGEFLRAEERFHGVIHLYKTSGNTEGIGIARVYVDLAALHSFKGQFDDALQYLSEARTHVQIVNDPPQGSPVMTMINVLAGMAHAGRGDLAEALSILEEAIADAKRQDLQLQRGAALSEVAKINIAQGNFEEALSQITEALGYADASSLDAVKAEARFDLAECLFNAGLTDQASTELSISFDFIQKMAIRHVQANAYALRAKIRYLGGDIDDAVADASVAAEFYYKQAVTTKWAREANEFLKSHRRKG
ncbi:MAG: KGGVGR-motif variant AAA ATPase [Capsulimonadaceae bacterium]